MEHQDTIEQLATATYHDKFIRARAEDPSEKFMAGFRLSEPALAFTKAEIAAELVTHDEEKIMQAL